MKRILRITAKYVEEWDDDDTQEDMDTKLEDYTFDDWEDCDWDNVGRYINNLQDAGWKITSKKIKIPKNE